MSYLNLKKKDFEGQQDADKYWKMYQHARQIVHTLQEAGYDKLDSISVIGNALLLAILEAKIHPEDCHAQLMGFVAYYKNIYEEA